MGSLVLRSPDRGWEFEILGESTAVLGRRAELVDICLPDATVSSRHARVFEHEGSWWIEDLASASGIYVNQRAVHGPLVMRTGDFVRLGGVTLTVETLDGQLQD